MPPERSASGEGEDVRARLRAWEAVYLDAPTPGERLAKVGRLIELYREWHPEFFQEKEDIEAIGHGIRRMHEALRRINLPRSQ